MPWPRSSKTPHSAWWRNRARPRSRSTRTSGKATLQRKLLFWNLKPLELALAEVAEFAVDAGVDRASGVEICNTMLVTRSGAAWALPAADRKDAEATAAAMRGFLGLK